MYDVVGICEEGGDGQSMGVCEGFQLSHALVELLALEQGWCSGQHCGGPGKGEGCVCPVPGGVVEGASFAGEGRGGGVQCDRLGT